MKVAPLSLLVLLVLLAFQERDDFAAGQRAYEAGRFDEALARFARLESERGSSASAELLYDQALAALRAGELDLAEGAARRAAPRAGPELAALCEFLQGNVAFARSERSEFEVRELGADRAALDRAIAQVEAARDAWQRAAASRADWPAARRNVERAQQRLVALDELRKKTAQQEPQPQPNAAAGAPEQEETRVEPLTTELTPEELLRLFDQLDEKERTKLALRRSRRAAQQEAQRGRGAVEKDW